MGRKWRPFFNWPPPANPGLISWWAKPKKSSGCFRSQNYTEIMEAMMRLFVVLFSITYIRGVPNLRQITEDVNISFNRWNRLVKVTWLWKTKAAVTGHVLESSWRNSKIFLKIERIGHVDDNIVFEPPWFKNVQTSHVNGFLKWRVTCFDQLSRHTRD